MQGNGIKACCTKLFWIFGLFVQQEIPKLQSGIQKFKQMYVCIKIKFIANMQQMIQNVFLLKTCALEKEKLKRNSLEVKKSIFDFLLLQQHYPV